MKSSEAFIRLTSFIFPKKEARCNIFVLQLSICQMQGKFYSVNGALSVFYVWIVATLSYVKLSFLSIWVSCKSVVIQLSIYHYLAPTLCLSPWILQSCVSWDVISNRNEVSHHTELNWHWWGDLFELYLQDKGTCCRLVKYIGRLE